MAADGRIEPGDMLLQVLSQIQNIIEHLEFSSSYASFVVDSNVFAVMKTPLWQLYVQFES